MKQGTRAPVEVDSASSTDEQLCALLSDKSFETFEYTKVFCETAVSFGWIILGFYVVSVWKQWLFSEEKKF